MYDGVKIGAGLVLFLMIALVPVIYNAVVGAATVPEVVIQTRDVPGREACVEPADYMRARHMELLDDWRDAVVRDGERDWRAADGRIFRAGLTGTCLDCHSNRDEFCDRCHNFLAVQPYCWDCHNTPETSAP